MGRLDGKVAIISGGAQGQGEAEAKLCAREGARIVLGDILDEQGGQVEAEIREHGGDATYIHLDVTNERDWERAVHLAESKYGKLDVLVNNAGIARRYSIEDTSEEMWDEVMAVNLKGVYFGIKYAVPSMRRAGGGSIVNISSIAALVARRYPAYTASKGAIRSLTKMVAVRYAEYGIRCNAVYPGPIDTPMLRIGEDKAKESWLTEVPLGRIGSSEDIAYGVLYLASDESSFVTGTDLVIDGGITAR